MDIGDDEGTRKFWDSTRIRNYGAEELPNTDCHKQTNKVDYSLSLTDEAFDVTGVRCSPEIIQITQHSKGPSGGIWVNLDVHFDEEIIVDSTNDFVLVLTDTATGTISGVVDQTNDIWRVTVNDIVGTGTIGVALAEIRYIYSTRKIQPISKPEVRGPNATFSVSVLSP